jgi:beta-1,4-N-acetylglucosaminyltransferase
MRAAWQEFSHAWVTLDGSDSRSLLQGERVFIAYGPTTRSVWNLLRNALVAWRVVRTVRPKAVLTTGAALAVPVAWTARAYGASIVFVELAGRTSGRSLASRLVAPIASRVYVQWPELASGRMRYVGNMFFSL